MFDILLHGIFICNRLVICRPMSDYKNKIGQILVDTYVSSIHFFSGQILLLYIIHGQGLKISLHSVC